MLGGQSGVLMEGALRWNRGEGISWGNKDLKSLNLKRILECLMI